MQKNRELVGNLLKDHQYRILDDFQSNILIVIKVTILVLFDHDYESVEDASNNFILII